MIKKSILRSNPQSGATMAEVLVGIAIFAMLIAITFVVLQGIRESSKIDRTLSALYSLKEEIRKVNRTTGSYTKGRMLPLLFASNAFPDTLDVDYEKKTISTPMGHPLDITGRGSHFSIDIYGMSPEDCYDFGEQIVAGKYFMMGNANDNLDYLKIGNMIFSDDQPLTTPDLEDACTQRFSIDVIMAFR